ncbi:hypothetical protein H310_11668 [Aphanomyces invadans]|uniref:Uncharacterized protein n=1 Tax=Aphanomyces invadans TaxID=157072 RepID=A0A024TKL3_9STRA|nr:hypothetical protein H310_11668 [Aphanomyces invadans]ETV94690.1 hypothetical protein H310_11668 [Aphanomyces invadans]|eukprot:XP_008876635.1 hypothetical protein H310_11668 [Aphanomyces invadans]
MSSSSKSRVMGSSMILHIIVDSTHEQSKTILDVLFDCIDVEDNPRIQAHVVGLIWEALDLRRDLMNNKTCYVHNSQSLSQPVLELMFQFFQDHYGSTEAQASVVSLCVLRRHQLAYSNGMSLPTVVAEHQLEGLRSDRLESTLKRESQLLVRMLKHPFMQNSLVRRYQKMMQSMFATTYSTSRVRNILCMIHAFPSFTPVENETKGSG